MPGLLLMRQEMRFDVFSLKIKLLYIEDTSSPYRKYAQEFPIRITSTKIEDWVSEMKVMF